MTGKRIVHGMATLTIIGVNLTTTPQAADPERPEIYTTPEGVASVPPESERGAPPTVGYEILQIVSPREVKAWATRSLTPAEFDAIRLPLGWFKNQPREAAPDRSAFDRSPDAAADGEFTEREMFGATWRHAATVTRTGIRLDAEGLLTGSTVAKFHEVTFHAGSTLVLLVSPQGETFVRITRDLGRTTDQPTIPRSWRHVEYVTPEQVVIDLPDETLVIRADNQDSYQGPVLP